MKIVEITDHETLLEYAERVEVIYQKVFSVEALFTPELLAKKRFHLLVALKDKEVIAFKAGYERKTGHFYSWLGGASPEWRGKGIGTTLMIKQHEWCKKENYLTIQTKTMNKWKNMLILNLKHGFDIIGTYMQADGKLKIILEKNLKDK